MELPQQGHAFRICWWGLRFGDVFAPLDARYSSQRDEFHHPPPTMDGMASQKLFDAEELE